MITSVSINELKEIIKFTIQHNLKHPIIGLGAPGIGKSECVTQVAKELGYSVTDLRLAQMSEVEIGGLIYPNADKTKTTWLKPDFFPEEGGPKTILLLDELTSAPKRIQVAAYQLVLDRRINRHVLPDSTVIVAMGNRAEDNAVYVEMSSALADRFEIYNVECSTDEWLNNYARKSFDDGMQNVHPLVTSFIEAFPSYLHTLSEDEDEMVFASPRSWKKVSDTITATNGELLPVVKKKITANVGDIVGSKFITHVEKYAGFDLAKKIMAGQDVQVPTDRVDLLYLIDSLNSSLNSMKAEGRSMDECATVYNRIMKFSGKIRGDYGVMLIKLVSEGNSDIVADANRMDSKAVSGVVERTKELNDLGSVESMNAFGEDDDPSDIYLGPDESEDIFL